jgi:predicted protein tyrosine phosphatase
MPDSDCHVLLAKPHIRLSGPVDQDMYFSFRQQLEVYSAGATFMSSFPVECRFVTKSTRLMIHERQMKNK